MTSHDTTLARNLLRGAVLFAVLALTITGVVTGPDGRAVLAKRPDPTYCALLKAGLGFRGDVGHTCEDLARMCEPKDVRPRCDELVAATREVLELPQKLLRQLPLEMLTKFKVE
jgi:hypothetical protein